MPFSSVAIFLYHSDDSNSILAPTQIEWAGGSSYSI